jgi:hypothetical protein
VFSDYKKRPLGLILLLLMILMGFEVGTKKPLCITSKIVNKIDRITLVKDARTQSIKAESIYSCSTYKIPRFSTYFYENLGDLNQRLHKIEKVAALLGINGQLDIEISEVTSGQLKLKNNKIAVSQDRLNDQELEKLVVTVLLLQNMKFESAHFAGFLAGWLTDQATSDSAFEEIWNDSFESLSVFEQFGLKEAIYARLRGLPEFNHKTLSENMQSLLTAETSSVQKFKSIFNERVRIMGVTNSSLVADLIFENLSEGDFDSESLLALAKSNKTKKIIFKDSSGTYLLPFMTKLDSQEATAPLRVLLVNSDSAKAPDVNQYLKNTERLVVFKRKAKDSQLKFSSLFASKDLKRNELAFLNANKGFDVIQFHIPSLSYAKSSPAASVAKLKDYFGLLRKANSVAVQKKLGWQSAEWSIEAQAFKPIAVYDVIQYYRIN